MPAESLAKIGEGDQRHDSFGGVWHSRGAAILDLPSQVHGVRLGKAPRDWWGWMRSALLVDVGLANGRLQTVG